MMNEFFKIGGRIKSSLSPLTCVNIIYLVISALFDIPINKHLQASYTLYAIDQSDKLEVDYLDRN